MVSTVHDFVPYRERHIFWLVGLGWLGVSPAQAWCASGSPAPPRCGDATMWCSSSENIYFRHQGTNKGVPSNPHSQLLPFVVSEDPFRPHMIQKTEVFGATAFAKFCLHFPVMLVYPSQRSSSWWDHLDPLEACRCRPYQYILVYGHLPGLLKSIYYSLLAFLGSLKWAEKKSWYKPKFPTLRNTKVYRGYHFLTFIIE